MKRLIAVVWSLSVAWSLALMSGSAQAAELRLLCAELPPFCYHDPSPIRTAVGERTGVPKGLVYDTVAAMAPYAGHSGRIEFMGWTVAQQLAQSGSNIGILALTRSPNREANYRWLVEIYRDDLLLVGTPGVDVSSLDAVKDRPIGVLRTSGAQALLREQGFTRISPRAQEWMNALDLRERHIDAWLGPRLMIVYAYREIGADPASLSFGMIVRPSPIYLAGSQDVSDEEMTRWQDAFKRIKADGTYERILATYRYTNVQPLPTEVLRREIIQWGY
ncbi:MAG: transporter substrate-binding domain-containing protein [Hyphomicrobiales bacterium]|nr:transporter substrate-binding domain-containing protein [Hyphomicrobiales bacterium]